MNDTPNKEWPEEREWPHDDARWEGPAVVHDLVAKAIKDRAACPFAPAGNYLVFSIATVDFFLESGIIIPNPDDPSGSGLHAPLMKIIAVGPDVKDYAPGDFILTHPRNPEIQVAWRDPRDGSKDLTYFFMKDDLVLAHYDREVIEQMRRRGRYLLKERELNDKVLNSPLNPNSGKELVDARGEPISKSGMHEEVLPE